MATMHPSRSLARLALLASVLALPGLARASVTSAQIYVKTRDAKRLQAAVSDYLGGWMKHPGAMNDPVWLPGAGRRLIVLPPHHGWATLIEGSDRAADPSLAEALSRALKTRVVWLEVLGDSLSWRYVILEKGKIIGTRAEPVPGFAASPVKGAMPTYHDVETLAWSLLSKEGIPAAYRFLRQADVHVSKHPKQGPQATIFRVVDHEQKLQAGTGHFGFALPDRGKTPPVVIDTFVPQKGMPAPGLGVDLLRLTGAPTPERLANLAQVLREVRKRYSLGGKVHFCHLVSGPYQVPVYQVLAKAPGDCQPVYRRLLGRARQAAAKEAKAAAAKQGPQPKKAKK